MVFDYRLSIIIKKFPFTKKTNLCVLDWYTVKKLTNHKKSVFILGLEMYLTNHKNQFSNDLLKIETFEN